MKSLSIATLIWVLAAVLIFSSCTTQITNAPVPKEVRAKLRLTYSPDEPPIIRYIDQMYNVGETIRVDGLNCTILAKDSIDLPEEINQAEVGDTLIVTQKDKDILRIGFKH